MSAKTFFFGWFFSLNGHWQTDVNMWVSFTLSLILLIDWNNLSFYNNVSVKSTCRGNLRDSMFETIWNISGPWVSPYWVVVVVECSWASYLDHLSVRVFSVKVPSQNSDIKWAICLSVQTFSMSLTIDIAIVLPTFRWIS